MIEAIILLGNLLIKQDRCAEALSLYRQYEQSTSSSVLRLQALRCQFREGQYEQAGKMIDAFESKSSRSYLMLAGELNLRKGDIKTALSDFYGISTTEKDFVIAYYLSVISLLRNDTELALAYLNQSLQKNALYTRSYLLAAVIYLSKHDYPEASKYAIWAANLEPMSIDAHAIQGVAAYIQEQYADASYAFDIVAEFAPEHPLPYFFKALMAMRQETGGAEGHGRELLNAIHAAYIERMLLAMGIGQRDWHNDPSQLLAFMTRYTAYLKAYPSLLGTLLAADYFQQTGDIDRAKVYVQEALKLRADCALCYYKLAYLANRREQIGAATDYLQRALEINAQFTAAYQALGGLYEQQGEYARALAIYKRGLSQTPDDVTLLNNIGWLTLVELDNPGMSYVYLRKAASMMPNDLDVQDSLAWWYFHNRDFERAVQLLEPLTHDYPANHVYQYHMGMAHIANGRLTVGQRHLRLALSNGLSGEAADRAREGLRR